MEILTFSGLLKDGLIQIINNGIIFRIDPSMIIEGEDRLSYTTLIRLVECCREYHWQCDITNENAEIDSICKCLNVNFYEPIIVGSQMLIKYSISYVGKKSYGLYFEVFNQETGNRNAVIKMVCVFYNPVSKKAIEPPSPFLKHLSTLEKQIIE